MRLKAVRFCTGELPFRPEERRLGHLADSEPFFSGFTVFRQSLQIGIGDLQVLPGHEDIVIGGGHVTQEVVLADGREVILTFRHVLLRDAESRQFPTAQREGLVHPDPQEEALSGWRRLPVSVNFFSEYCVTPPEAVSRGSR